MNLDSAIAQVVTHAAAAGTALTIPITDVARADPIPRGRCIRVWYGGEAEPPAMPGNRSLNSELVGEIVNITCFWPVGDSAEVLASSRDAEVVALVDGLRTLIQGDSDLGGNCTDLDMHYGTVQFVPFSGAIWRTLEIELVLSYADYTKAP